MKGQIRHWKSCLWGVRRKLAEVIAPSDYYRFPKGFRFEQKIKIPQLGRESVGHSDISDHLANLFFHALSDNPRLIVELGTRGGESTRVLLTVAKLTGGSLLSIDISDCSGVIPDEDWSFVRADDVEFAEMRFESWCRNRNLAPEIGVLFIDTSHEYEHTCRELRAWMPFVGKGGKVILHDTNTVVPYFRMDGSKGYGQESGRGVARALEEYLGILVDEGAFYATVQKGLLVINYPFCNGLCVMKRMA